MIATETKPPTTYEQPSQCTICGHLVEDRRLGSGRLADEPYHYFGPKRHPLDPSCECDRCPECTHLDTFQRVPVCALCELRPCLCGTPWGEAVAVLIENQNASQGAGETPKVSPHLPEPTIASTPRLATAAPAPTAIADHGIRELTDGKD